MRILVATLLSLCFALAQELEPGAMGTRSGGPLATQTQAATPVGASNAAQMLAALALVALALRYGLPLAMRWAGRSGSGSQLDGEIRIIETRAVPNGSLSLIRVRGRLMLIASNAQSVQLLTVLEEHPEPLPSDNAFEQALIRSVKDDERAALQDKIRAATERLRSMAGERD